MSLQKPTSLPLVCTECSSLCNTLELLYVLPYSTTARSLEEYADMPDYEAEYEYDIHCIASLCFTNRPPCCQLYNLLFQVRSGFPGKEEYKIVLDSSVFKNSAQNHIKVLFDTSVIAVISANKLGIVFPDSQFVYPTSISIPGDKTKAILGRKVPEYLDYGILKNWIKTCQEDHRGTCCIDTGDLSNIPGFRLIVCSTGEIVSAPPQAEFVALSYVWGTVTSGPDTNARTVPVTAALVIRDAMVVAKNIGYRYLWVDRYCIPQDDEEAKHAQIMRMDLIYKSAQLTIISAAGQDGSSGIPGVSTVPRTPQPHIDLPSVSLVSCLPSQQYEVNQSIWATRGWTYQEGVLPRRCLVFTQYQASFQCATHYYPCESIDEPKFVVARSGLDSEWDRRENNPLPIKIDTKPSSIGACLNEYVKRELTYESDILNAIQGVLNDFVARKVLDCHIWDIPVLRSLHLYQSEDNQQPLTLDEKFAHALCWVSPGVGHWNEEYISIRRRPGFPSWSWVGWVGLRGWRYCSPLRDEERLPNQDPWVEPPRNASYSLTLFHCTCKITIALRDGTMKRLDEMQTVHSDVHLMPYIFIEALSFNLSFSNKSVGHIIKDHVTYGIRSDSGEWPLCPVIPMNLVDWNKHLKENPQFVNHIMNSTWTALLIGRAETMGLLYLLIIENVGDHFERAGVLTSSGQNREYDRRFRDVPMERKTFKLS